jgi:ArsR family transcriptional regulator, lead/cadmium/zinc/bismuth-responsive transcriptional repressor
MLNEQTDSPAHRQGDPLDPDPALLDDDSVVALAETFRMLGDNTRVRILDVISRRERCVCDIARAVGMSESAVSHQLRLLRGQRLVRPRRSGRQVFYVLDDHHIVRLFAQGLEHVQENARSSRLRRAEPAAEQS